MNSLQVLIDELAHFDRERIPERVVHAKGAGAFGYFEVTHDITKYCKVKSKTKNTYSVTCQLWSLFWAVFDQVGS